MSEGQATLDFLGSHGILVDDYAAADLVSIAVKNLLKNIGFPAPVLPRVAIIAFEAEMNAGHVWRRVAHGGLPNRSRPCAW